MEDFIFQETEPGGNRIFDFEPSLFHFPDHLYQQSPTGWTWFNASHRSKKKIAISLYMHVSGDTATSAIRSPFGTVEASDKVLPETLYKFLLFVEKSLALRGVSKIIFKSPPVLFDPIKEPILQTCFFNLGYHVVDARIGTVRFIEDTFESGLNRLEKRKQRIAKEAGLHGKFLPNVKLEKIYKFISSCRRQKEYALSMSFEDLEQTVKKFPQRYLLAGVYKNDELMAASIAVRISSDILYNFYADHSAAYDHLSPVVLVVETLYNYCREKQIALLDYGTSAGDGQPNFGLLTFKMRLGGIPSSKHTFEKVITP